MEITATQGPALAALLHEMRPDWTTGQLSRLLYENRARDFHEVCEAAVRAARNPAVRSPSVIFMPGAHWDQKTPTVKADGPACRDHPHEQAASCSCCWADVKAGIRSADQVGVAL